MSDVIRIPKKSKPIEMEDGLDAEQLEIRRRRDMQKEAASGNQIAKQILQREAAVPAPQQLPLWPETKRGIPEDFACSALFGMVSKGTRVRYDVETEIEAWGDTVMTYKGEQLGQRDLDVYMHVLHLFRDQVIEKNRPRVGFSLSEMLRFLGKTRGSKNMKTLKETLSRLQYCQVNIRKTSINKAVFSSSLISNFSFNESTQLFTVGIHPDTVLLFGPAYPQIDVEERRALTGDLAQWVHAYVARHRATMEDPHNIRVERIKALTGSSTYTTMSHMRLRLRKAMTQLSDRNIVIWWKITDNNVLWFAKK